MQRHTHSRTAAHTHTARASRVWKQAWLHARYRCVGGRPPFDAAAHPLCGSRDRGGAVFRAIPPPAPLPGRWKTGLSRCWFGGFRWTRRPCPVPSWRQQVPRSVFAMPRGLIRGGCGPLVTALLLLSTACVVTDGRLHGLRDRPVDVRGSASVQTFEGSTPEWAGGREGGNAVSGPRATVPAA